MIRFLFVLGGLAGLGVALARASATSPTLIVSAGRVMAAEGRYTVTIEGTFDFANAVQVGYPLEIVVFQGTRFVRYPLRGPAVTGTSAAVADGRLSAAELATFFSAGVPAAPDVRLLGLTSDSAVLTLPAEFVRGAATVQSVARLPEEPVLSNPLAVVLP